jgi:hypothetical protein
LPAGRDQSRVTVEPPRDPTKPSRGRTSRIETLFISSIWRANFMHFGRSGTPRLIYASLSKMIDKRLRLGSSSQKA